MKLEWFETENATGPRWINVIKFVFLILFFVWTIPAVLLMAPIAIPMLIADVKANRRAEKKAEEQSSIDVYANIVLEGVAGSIVTAKASAIPWQMEAME